MKSSHGLALGYQREQVLMDDTAWTKRNGWRNLACSPVLAMTIQKISIKYCSYYSEGTLMWSMETAMLSGGN